MLKYDPLGRLLWQRTWGSFGFNNSPLSLAADSEGNAVIAGLSERPPYGYPSVSFLVKWDPSGNLLWQKIMGNYSFGEPQVSIDSSNNIYALSGLIYYLGNSTFPSWETSLQKLSSSGYPVWQKSWPGAARSRVAIDLEGNIVVTGTGATGELELIKFNSTGALVWQRTTQGYYYGAYSLAIDTAGEIYVTGLGIHEDPFVSKYDASGDLVWGRVWHVNTGGNANCYGCHIPDGVAVTPSGEVYVTVVSTWQRPGSFLFVFNSTGTLLWQDELLGGINLQGNIAVNSSQDLYLTGSLSAPPPYPTCISTSDLRPFSNATATSNYAFQSLNVIWNPSNGTVAVPSGNTSYTGTADALLLHYGGGIPTPVTACPNVGLSPLIAPTAILLMAPLLRAKRTFRSKISQS